MKDMNIASLVEEKLKENMKVLMTNKHTKKLINEIEDKINTFIRIKNNSFSEYEVKLFPISQDEIGFEILLYK